MKLAFWSPLAGTGTTAVTAAVTAALKERLKGSVLLTEVKAGQASLIPTVMYPLQNRRRGWFDAPGLKEAGANEVIRRMGMDTLIRYFKAGALTHEVLRDCMLEPAEGIFLLAGCSEVSDEADEALRHRILLHTLKEAEKYYGLVAVDAGSGYAQSTLEILEAADVTAVVLLQDKRSLDGLFSDSFEDKLHSEKCFYIFNRYDADSKYNLGNVRRLYGKIKSINSAGLMPCTGYMDALCEGRAIRYVEEWQRGRIPGNTFTTDLNEICVRLAAKLKGSGRA